MATHRLRGALPGRATPAKPILSSSTARRNALPNAKVEDESRECTKAPRHSPSNWCQQRGSNPRPSVYKTAALPLSYTGYSRPVFVHRERQATNRCRAPPASRVLSTHSAGTLRYSDAGGCRERVPPGSVRPRWGARNTPSGPLLKKIAGGLRTPAILHSMQAGLDTGLWGPAPERSGVDWGRFAPLTNAEYWCGPAVFHCVSHRYWVAP